MRMSKKTDAILKQKSYWIQKQHSIITQMSVASFEGDQEKYAQLSSDLETAAIILWRFDRKMEDVINADKYYDDLDAEFAELLFEADE